MNDHKENDDNGLELIGPAADNQRQLELFGEAIKLEHRRLDEYSKRTELARHSFDLLDQRDQRQSELATREIEANERANIRRHSLTLKFFWVFVAIVGAPVVAFLAIIALVLFGTPEQSAVATTLLKYAGTAMGGAGVGYAMLAAIQHLLRR